MPVRKKKIRRTSGKAAKKRGKKASAPGRGRRLTAAEQQRRLDALDKHGRKDSPEPLTAQAIADKLGINVGTWNVWKSNQNKKSGTAGRRGRPRKAASSLDSVIAGFREIERERDQLRRVLDRVQRALAEMP
jgi:hypothetical protein